MSCFYQIIIVLTDSCTACDPRWNRTGGGRSKDRWSLDSVAPSAISCSRHLDSVFSISHYWTLWQCSSLWNHFFWRHLLLIAINSVQVDCSIYYLLLLKLLTVTSFNFGFILMKSVRWDISSPDPHFDYNVILLYKVFF